MHSKLLYRFFEAQKPAQRLKVGRTATFMTAERYSIHIQYEPTSSQAGSIYTGVQELLLMPFPLQTKIQIKIGLKGLMASRINPDEQPCLLLPQP